jgi:hypothetical protein|tara:strand:- start:258 stop:899 length:642 start_codon:yes stop_codon:yes gene_type:complete
MNRLLTGGTSLNSFIKIFDNLVPKSLCDDLIHEYGNDLDVWNTSAILGSIDNPNQVKKSFRSSEGVNISDRSVLNKNYKVRSVLDKAVFDCVSEGIKKYSELYPDIRITKDTGYEVLKYSSGGFYKQHVDSFNQKEITQNEAGELAVLGCREISCVIQLNDNFEGGGLSFFDDTHRIPIKTGSAVYFPSNFMFPHQALTVTKGFRYTIVTWFN